MPLPPSFLNRPFFLFLLPVREKGVLASATRHHRASHTATRSANVTRPHSRSELRIAGGLAAGEGFSSLGFMLLICIGLLMIGRTTQVFGTVWIFFLFFMQVNEKKCEKGLTNDVRGA